MYACGQSGVSFMHVKRARLSIDCPWAFRLVSSTNPTVSAMAVMLGTVRSPRVSCVPIDMRCIKLDHQPSVEEGP